MNKDNSHRDDLDNLLYTAESEYHICMPDVGCGMKTSPAYQISPSAIEQCPAVKHSALNIPRIILISIKNH